MRAPRRDNYNYSLRRAIHPRANTLVENPSETQLGHRLNHYYAYSMNFAAGRKLHFRAWQRNLTTPKGWYRLAVLGRLERVCHSLAVPYNKECSMSWETPKFHDVSLAMECSSYANADEFGQDEPTDPGIDL